MENETLPVRSARSDNGYRDIATFLSDTEVLLENTCSNAVISAKMGAAGFPETDIRMQLTSLRELRSLHQQQMLEYGEQKQATEAWEAQRDKYNPVYQDHIALGRIAFRKDLAAQRALGLVGSRAESQASYILQGMTFYANALRDAGIRAGLASKGITTEALEGGRNAFERLQALKGKQQREIGEAQQATKRRDDAWDALAEWEMDFRATAKVVLRSDGQLMEQIGMMQR